MPDWTVQSFAASIRNKYDAYYDLSDNDLVDQIVAKYPVYAEQITNILQVVLMNVVKLITLNLNTMKLFLMHELVLSFI